MRSHRVPVALAALVVAAASFACSSDERGATDTVRAVAPPPPPPAGSPGCPADGRWSPCALVDRMTKAGVGFRPTDDSLRIPGMTPAGARYRIGKTVQLVAFFYPDSTALLENWRRIDTLRLALPPRSAADSLGGWPSRPFVVRSANLVAALLDGSPTQEERILLAITAGAPQPRTGDTVRKLDTMRSAPSRP